MSNGQNSLEAETIRYHEHPRPGKLEVVASNGFGFGGHNSCLMIRKFEG